MKDYDSHAKIVVCVCVCVVGAGGRRGTGVTNSLHCSYLVLKQVSNVVV